MKKTNKTKSRPKAKSKPKNKAVPKAKPKFAIQPKAEVRLQPIGDRVVVRPQAMEEKHTKSGLIIPDTASKEKPETGRVVAVGTGRMSESGSRMAMSIKVGDIVLFSKYVPDEIKLDGEDLIILREDQILGIINN